MFFNSLSFAIFLPIVFVLYWFVFNSSKKAQNRAYFEDVVKLYPEVHNFEAVVTREDCFSSCGHRNEKGAVIFTEFLLDKFFK